VVLLNIDVLARMCSVLDCGIDELLEYVENWHFYIQRS
jgi:DNA-binding Xre family transcriptional regulator